MKCWCGRNKKECNLRIEKNREKARESLIKKGEKK